MSIYGIFKQNDPFPNFNRIFKFINVTVSIHVQQTIRRVKFNSLFLNFIQRLSDAKKFHSLLHMNAKKRSNIVTSTRIHR